MRKTEFSGMKTSTIAKMLDSNKAKLDQRKRQADRVFTLHATAETDEESVDFLNLFELLVQEITALESNVEMFQSALKKRADRVLNEYAVSKDPASPSDMDKVYEAVAANCAPRYPRTTKISK